MPPPPATVGFNCLPRVSLHEILIYRRWLHLSISPLGENGQATPACLQHRRRVCGENLDNYFIPWAKPKTKAAQTQICRHGKKRTKKNARSNFNSFGYKVIKNVFQTGIWTDLEKAGWHGSSWHALTRGHPPHHRAGGCCCTLPQGKTNDQTLEPKWLGEGSKVKCICCACAALTSGQFSKKEQKLGQRTIMNNSI